MNFKKEKYDYVPTFSKEFWWQGEVVSYREESPKKLTIQAKQ